MKISIINKAAGNTSAYAEKELKHFLEIYTHYRFEGENPDRYFMLAVCDDNSLKPHAYHIRGGAWQGKPAVYLTGGTESSLLTAVYEALGMMGIFFRIDGPMLKHGFDVTAADAVNRTFVPFCRNRGVRQHINFPMDISSYGIAEAQEYIRNLARMRMNSITFHSYTGQWHGYQSSKKRVYAGHFFYGQRHVVPKDPVIARAVPNRRFFCIPEAEPVLHDDTARAEFAVYWLNRVMETAKEAGMNVVLSIELPGEETRETLIEMVRGVVKNYPRIDALEWISPEGGGEETASFPLSELREKLVSTFGEAVLKAGEIPYMPERIPDALPRSMNSLKRAIDLYREKDRIFDGLPEKPIYIGLYVMCRETLKVLKNVMDSVLPEGVMRTFLPAHGSKAVADNVRFMEFEDRNWQNTLMYSWIEFDGNMYLQQNGCDGIEDLLSAAGEKTSTGSIHGMCLNHWRTAENNVTIAYAAEAMLHPIKADDFYKKYADVFGIAAPELLKDILSELGDLDIYNRDHLFNIGFCYLGCWLGMKGLGWIRGWKPECIEQAMSRYQRLLDKLNSAMGMTEKKEGVQWIRFLLNRIECSTLHLRVIKSLKEICRFADDDNPQKLSAAEKEAVVKYCDEALGLSKRYIQKHMEMAPDRGCLGTAVSYYATIPTYIDHIKQYFAFAESECKHRPTTLDSPPPPDSAFVF